MKLPGRYFYSIVFLAMTALLFVIAGFSLSNLNTITNLSMVINSFYTWLWRCGVYCLLWTIWKPLITNRIGSNTKLDIKSVVKKSRIKLLVAILLFELFIVQNIFWSAIVTIEGLLYGR